MKFLTVCDAGMNRSHTMAIVLKQHYHEAFAIGRYNSKPETMKMMCEWADVIVTMQEEMINDIPEAYKDKVYCVEVGPDIYGRPGHPDCDKICREGAHYLFGKLQREGKI